MSLVHHQFLTFTWVISQQIAHFGVLQIVHCAGENGQLDLILKLDSLLV